MYIFPCLGQNAHPSPFSLGVGQHYQEPGVEDVTSIHLCSVPGGSKPTSDNLPPDNSLMLQPTLNLSDKHSLIFLHCHLAFVTSSVSTTGRKKIYALNNSI